MLTLAGRMYDQMVTREPRWDEPPLPGDPGWPRCSACGCWLRLGPDRVEPWSHDENCGGAESDTGFTQCGRLGAHASHRFTAAAGATARRVCRRCGTDNAEETG